MENKKSKGVDGAIVLFHNRLCVRRGFRMYVSNREIIESNKFNRWLQSDILDDALNSFFHSLLMKPKEEIVIPSERVNRSEEKVSSIYIELKNDAKITDLTELGYTKQAIINHALKLHLER